MFKVLFFTILKKISKFDLDLNNFALDLNGCIRVIINSNLNLDHA